MTDLTATEAALLPILRRFCDAFLCPDGMAWREAYAVAAMTWGAGRGLEIAHAAQDFLAALMMSRPVPLRMCSAGAPLHRPVQDERAILNLIAAMQVDKTANARDEIAKLTFGRVEAAVIRTGLALAGLLDPVHPAARPDARPTLCVVT